MSGNVATEGGGFWNGSGTMTIEGVTFTDNTADGPDADHGGGALYNTGGGTLDVDGASFGAGMMARNELGGNDATGTSGSGGAILSTSGTVTVDNSGFFDNTANRAGGAVEIIDGTYTSRNNRYGSNVAGPEGTANPGNGGALHVSGTDGTQTSFTDDTFRGNVAASEGGALWNQWGSTMTVNGGVFEFNEARGDDASNGGGAIFNNNDMGAADQTLASSGGTLIIDASDARRTNFGRNLLVWIRAGLDDGGNAATGASGSGGAINSQAGTVTIAGTDFRGNTATRAGGAIENVNGTLTTTDVVYMSNETGSNPGSGGAIHNKDGAVRVNGGSADDNRAAAFGGAFWTQGAQTFTVDGTRLGLGLPGGPNWAGEGGAFYNADGVFDFIDVQAR